MARVTDDPPPTASAVALSRETLLVRARRGGPVVRSEPRLDGTILTGLYYDTYLPVFGQWQDPAGRTWYLVILWGVLPGWILADDTETGDPPTPTPRPTPAPDDASPPSRPSRRSAVLPLASAGRVRDFYYLRDGATTRAQPLDTIPPDTVVSVRAWQTDDDGSVWYQIAYGDEIGWISGGGLDLENPRPAGQAVSGRPAQVALAGKGMWLPVPLLEMADPAAVVQAALALGLTHVYLEVGDSSRGFYGQAQVDRFLPLAHAAGLTVVGWILTTLDRIPDDVALCRAVLAHTTPTGDRLDGIAPDVEFNMAADDVRTFSEILRATIGPHPIVVGVIYPVGSWIGQQHPIAGILARSVDALAPMAYWHEAQRSFTADEVASFVAQAVADVREAVDDPLFPVEIIAQTYDSFGRNGIGPNNPTGEEVSTALTAARDAGATGVSLFQWGTTTPDEWEALRALPWPKR